MVHWSFILGQGWLLNFVFVKHVKLSSSKFCHSTQSSADALIVALLWKIPQMPSCCTNNANLDKTNFDMFYKTDCCASIHDQIWMNNVPNLSRLIMLSCTEISFDISFFNVENFGVKPGFPFTQLNQATYSKLGGKKYILTRLTKWLLSSHLLSNMHDQCVIWKSINIVLSFLDISFVIFFFFSSEIWN